jgi:surface protein
MRDMFFKATSFNADLSKWDVSKVTDMSSMFYEAVEFDADLSKWDVSNVKWMVEMFNGARSFTAKLCGTWLTSKADKHAMFDGSSGQICGKTSTNKPQPLPWPLSHGNHHSAQR